MRCKGAANALVRKIDARGRGPAEIVGALRRPGGFLSQAVRDSARWIVEDVRDRGDAALLEYTERFDGVRPQEIRVPQSEIDRARGSLSPELEESFSVAIDNVRAFHEKEMDRSWERSHAAYPSTLVMSAVPAQVAGVRGVGICTPPGPDGLPDSNVLAVAGLLGLEQVYAVGGAQAIAALAYGTESVAAVDKIVGPGNDYVTAAKLEVFGIVGIDAPQGPSEVLVIADAGAVPERVATDLMAQAEHLSGASAVLLTPSENLIDCVEPLLSGEPAEYVCLVCVEDLVQAVEISNRYAPEHAHVISDDHEAVVRNLDAVGMVAVGDFSPVALGDYAAGPSHALPSGGTATWASALGTHDFLARTNYIHFTRDALRDLGQHVERLARLEGFEYHAMSVTDRVG